MNLTKIIHPVIKACLRSDWDFFNRNMEKSPVIQKRFLKNLLAVNQDTEFGKRAQFKNIKDHTDYYKAVPVHTYEDYQPYIQRIVNPSVKVLTMEPVRLFEPTSGSGAAIKMIPYTSSLKRDFNRSINAWLYDLYRHLPAVGAGNHFWSISPVLKAVAPFATNVPIGFDDDSQYLGIAGRLINKIFALPKSVRHISSNHDYLYAAGLFLLRHPDLSVVSVWSPTYLIMLLDVILTNRESLTRDIFNGNLSTAEKQTLSLLKNSLYPDHGRACALEKLFNSFENHNDQTLLWAGVWKKLGLISAWGDSYSRGPFEQIKALFPNVYVQAKGLLCTEAVISIPWINAGGALPAYPSHFFEFIELDSGTAVTGTVSNSYKRPLLLDELSQNKSYEVIVSTSGGLYRYSICDVVTITGFFRNLPVIRFSGRVSVVDLAGEKLNEIYLQSVINQCLEESGLKPDFLLVAPGAQSTKIFYILFIEITGNPGHEKLLKLIQRIEQLLQMSYHYQYARRLGQVDAIRLFRISCNGQVGYYDRLLKEGMKSGDIKLKLLDKRNNWKNFFTGEFIL